MLWRRAEVIISPPLAVSKLNAGLSSGIQGYKFYPENTRFNATVSFAYFCSSCYKRPGTYLW